MNNSASSHSFRPAWWLPDGHSQTLWRKFAPAKEIAHRRQRLELADGDFIDLDWAQEPDLESDNNQPIVFVVHGLCGCSSSSYVLSLQSVLSVANIPSVAMNLRGCSGEINRLARAYHSGVSDDLEEVFSKVAAEYPDNNFMFVGYSLGANVLLKWLGESGGRARVKKAVAVSTPFSLALCSREMLAGLSKIYGKYFVRNLLQNFLAKRKHFKTMGEQDQLQNMLRLGEVENITSIWEFDDKITAPLHGFKNAEDYYSLSSSIGFLNAIETDTLLIHSRNDPMIPELAIPGEGDFSASVQLRLSDKGGHVGFISREQDDWLEHQILDYIQR